MKKKLAVMVAFSLMMGTISVPYTPAQVLPYVSDGIEECELGVFESEEKKEGIITQNYDEKQVQYNNQLSEFCAGCTSSDGIKGHPTGYIYATMDGENRCPLYWSSQTYKDTEGKDKYMAVLKPQDGKGWSTDSSIVFKPYELIHGCVIYLSASEKGPRDIKIECTVDGGKTYHQLGEGIISLNNDKQVQNVMAECEAVMSEMFDIYKNDERYQTVINGTTIFAYDKFMHDANMQLRISVASDYRMDGTTGLLGSTEGELVIHQYATYQSYSETDEIGFRPSVTAYKIANKKVKLSWWGDSGVKSYEVYQKKANGTYKKIRTIKATDKNEYSCTISKLKPNKTYSFYVKAVLDNETVDSIPVTVNMKQQLIPKDIKLTKKITLIKGQKKKVPLTYKKGTKKSFVKSIEYKVAKKKIAKVKNGKIIAKKKGTTNLKVKITLQSGLKKTLNTKVVVK